MTSKTQQIVAFATLLCLASLPSAQAQDSKPVRIDAPISFHASFDDVCDANLSNGSGWIYTAETLARKKVREGNHRQDVKIVKGAGRFGDALYFAAKSKQVLFYKCDEIYIPKHNWSATFSFWLKLDPDKDLKPGYCDPLQFTEKAWNNAALFVDFDKELPRDFRLGVFPDYGRWNPDDTPWDEIPVDKRPLVTVKQPPFAGDAWTHVVFTLANANPAEDELGAATLYLNGKSQGTLRQPIHFSWDREKAAIMIGINYIGYFDDLGIFDRALTPEQVVRLYQLPEGIKSLK